MLVAAAPTIIHGCSGALVSHRSSRPTRLPRGEAGPSEADVRPSHSVLSAHSGDWLLSFVYRTSSVKLRVAGLQPVLLQDKRVENVDLSSMVSITCPSRGWRAGHFVTPAQQPRSQGHWPGLSPPQRREVMRIHLGRGNSCSRAPSLCWGIVHRPLGRALLSPFHRLGN